MKKVFPQILYLSLTTNRCQTQEEASTISKSGQDFMNLVEGSNKPVVAAIMGPCLGGGLEVAMGCHFRIAVDGEIFYKQLFNWGPFSCINVSFHQGYKTTLGLPEVMLGLLPGSGGTQRLPKLVGLPNSLDLSLTGKSLKPAKAKKMGLVDMLVAPLGAGLSPAEETTRRYLEDVAVNIAKELVSGKMKLPARGKPKNFTEKVMMWAMKYDAVKVIKTLDIARFLNTNRFFQENKKVKHQILSEIAYFWTPQCTEL